jgi:hypothetical protein
MGTKRAKRRRRERKREKREANPRPRPTPALAGAAATQAPPPRPQLEPPTTDDSPGDRIAQDLLDDDDGGAAVREPLRPKPNAPLLGAASIEPPPPDEPADAVAIEE